jgi:galactose mutarotase-like enzyme
MPTVLENDIISIKINDVGAELASLYKKNTKTEFLWQADPKYWARHAPILFPIIGKLNNDQTVIKGKHYKMGQHGFARDLTHKLIEKTKSIAIFSVKSSLETMQNYPYEFELTSKYEILNNTTKITYSIKNPSNESMYFSFGLHPAFQWPLHPNDKKENCFIEFEKNESADRIVFDGGFITGEKMPWLKNDKQINLYDDLFEKDVLIFKNLNSQKVTLKSTENKNTLEVLFDDFPYLGIWTKPGNPFICIEPWFGVADNKNNPKPFVDKEGIQKIKAGQTFECSVAYTIN